MLNFEEELNKFKPSTDIDEAEEAIYNREVADVTDFVKEMLDEIQKDSRRMNQQSKGRNGNEML
ncbi:MAG: hypothetical protein IK152_03960 [Lachnospiraceae bacterium]|nr:hypothetical protein [Lachnospiraceae bacterium]